MIKLIVWLVKGIAFVTLWAIASWCCILLSLILWDGRFMDMAQQGSDLIWNNDPSKVN